MFIFETIYISFSFVKDETLLEINVSKAVFLNFKLKNG